MGILLSFLPIDLPLLYKNVDYQGHNNLCFDTLCFKSRPWKMFTRFISSPDIVTGNWYNLYIYLDRNRITRLPCWSKWAELDLKRLQLVELEIDIIVETCLADFYFYFSFAWSLTFSSVTYGDGMIIQLSKLGLCLVPPPQGGKSLIGINEYSKNLCNWDIIFNYYLSFQIS